MILELMGRDAGFISLYAGLAGGADIILIPEIPFTIEGILKKVHARAEQGVISVLSSYRKVVNLKENRSSGRGESGNPYNTHHLGGIGEYWQQRSRRLVI